MFQATLDAQASFRNEKIRELYYAKIPAMAALA
jgi:hypothetical protein